MASEIDRLDREFPDATIDEISDEHKPDIEAAFDTFFKSRSGENDSLSVKHFIEDTQRLIFHVDGRINYWENRRTQFLQIGAASLTASIVGIVSLFPEIPNAIALKDGLSLKSIVMLPTFVASIALFFGNIKLINIWNRQNNPNYPFTKGTKTWRWHYRHAELNEVETDTDKFNEAKFAEEARIFADNSAYYKIKTLTSSTKELIDQDLSQLYLLLTNEKFKVKFVNKLRDCLLNTLLIALYLAALTFFITLIIFCVI